MRFHHVLRCVAWADFGEMSWALAALFDRARCCPTFANELRRAQTCVAPGQSSFRETWSSGSRLRTVMKERDENAGGALLDWFRMLRVNLPSYNDREALYKNTAIIVIGTHIDLLPPDQRLEDACKKRDRYVKRIASKAGLDWFLELKKFVQPSHMMIQKLPNCSCYCVARQPNLLVKAELSQKSFWTWREKLTVRGAHKKYGMKIIGLSNRLPNWMWMIALLFKKQSTFKWWRLHYSSAFFKQNCIVINLPHAECHGRFDSMVKWKFNERTFQGNRLQGYLGKPI